MPRAGLRRLRVWRQVDDPTRCRELAFAAVFVGDLGRDRRLARAVVETVDERSVALGDERAPHLLRAGQFAVVRVELLGQDEESPDLRARHGRLLAQRAIDRVDVLFDHGVDAAGLRPAPGRSA